MRSCNFDCYGLCGAKVCYSNEKCNSKNENGSPKYATNDWAIINHLRDTIEALQQEIERLQTQAAAMREALEHIAEYWNRNNNEKAMEDACWHAIETAVEALGGDTP